MFFAGLFIIVLALFFFIPGQQQGRLVVNETGAHADRVSPTIPRR
jgi:hypothetical protein